MNDRGSRGGEGLAGVNGGEAQALIGRVVGRLFTILKIWRPQEIQGKVRVVCSLSWQRNCSDLLQQGSRANLKLCHPSCRGIFHDLAGIRVCPVELSCVVITSG